MVTQRLLPRGYDALQDVQVLTPMHKGPLGSEALNEALQNALNANGRSLNRGKRCYREGDRVLQQRNDYDKEVFNGDVGLVLEVQEAAMTVRFGARRVNYVGDEIDDLVLAYAISVHKSQGSEYPAVVSVVHSGYFVMLRRNLLYTAMTRAKALRHLGSFLGVAWQWTGLRGDTPLSDHLRDTALKPS